MQNLAQILLYALDDRRALKKDFEKFSWVRDPDS